MFFFGGELPPATCNLQAGRGRAFPEMTVPTVRAAKSVAGNRPGFPHLFPGRSPDGESKSMKRFLTLFVGPQISPYKTSQNKNTEIERKIMFS